MRLNGHTYPESYITKYTSIRRTLVPGARGGSWRRCREATGYEPFYRRETKGHKPFYWRETAGYEPFNRRETPGCEHIVYLFRARRVAIGVAAKKNDLS